MLESFLFIPASHRKLKSKIEKLKADNFIIDFEDGFKGGDNSEAYSNIADICDKSGIWIRPSLLKAEKNGFDSLSQFNNLGFSNFVIPKIRNVSDVNNIKEYLATSCNSNLRIIVLIENPECLFNLERIIIAFGKNIVGIGFGSHDYCLDSGMKHEPDLLRLPRFLIANTAKAMRVKSIDIACMDYGAGVEFEAELIEAIKMGYDGKFLIHPDQLSKINEYDFFSREEITKACEVLQEYDRIGRPAVWKYKGKAIEPPHIKRYLQIQSWRKKHGTK